MKPSIISYETSTGTYYAMHVFVTQILLHHSLQIDTAKTEDWYRITTSEFGYRLAKGLTTAGYDPDPGVLYYNHSLYTGLLNYLESSIRPDMLKLEDGHFFEAYGGIKAYKEIYDRDTLGTFLKYVDLNERDDTYVSKWDILVTLRYFIDLLKDTITTGIAPSFNYE